MSITIDGQYHEICDDIFELLLEIESVGKLIYKGRNSLYQAEIETIGALVVKQFRKPNLVQRLSRFFRKTKAERAYDNAKRLRFLGVETPERIAYVEFYNVCWCWKYLRKTALITRYLPHATHVKPILLTDPLHRTALRNIARFVALTHRRGAIHKDLSPGNIICEENNIGKGPYYFVDINRMYFAPKGKEASRKELCRSFSRLCISQLSAPILAKYYAEAYLAESTQAEQQDFSREIVSTATHYFARRTRLKTIKYTIRDKGLFSADTRAIARWWVRHERRKRKGIAAMPISPQDKELYNSFIVEHDVQKQLANWYADSHRSSPTLKDFLNKTATNARHAP